MGPAKSVRYNRVSVLASNFKYFYLFVTAFVITEFDCALKQFNNETAYCDSAICRVGNSHLWSDD